MPVRIMGDIISPNLDITASVKMKQAVTEFVYVFVLGGGGHQVDQHWD